MTEYEADAPLPPDLVRGLRDALLETTSAIGALANPLVRAGQGSSQSTVVNHYDGGTKAWFAALFIAVIAAASMFCMWVWSEARMLQMQSLQADLDKLDDQVQTNDAKLRAVDQRTIRLEAQAK
jgi:hypothetical protein